ncbi:hypothetical protein HAX54_025926 [Datura stramonium]|uniref:Uncharacterized protein n=1 Tax=Datura stramonium TaxID=4076 RepID=A0ABS8V0B7_DATST|nr:hypothetical protein [Datura stramonium]
MPKIVGRIPSDVPWKSFIEILCCTKQRECREVFQCGDSDGGKLLELQEVLSSNRNLECSEESSDNAVVSMDVTLLQKFSEALLDSISFIWKKIDENHWFTPGCFLYLLERFLILVSQYQERSSLLNLRQDGLSLSSLKPKNFRHAISPKFLEEFYDSILLMVQYFIYDKAGTVEWLERSNINFNLYYKQMVLRLVLILCLLCELRKLATNCSREDILSLLLPAETGSSIVHTTNVPGLMPDPSANFSLHCGDESLE